jgi:hypothetical protein
MVVSEVVDYLAQAYHLSPIGCLHDGSIENETSQLPQSQQTRSEMISFLGCPLLPTFVVELDR